MTDNVQPFIAGLFRVVLDSGYTPKLNGIETTITMAIGERLVLGPEVGGYVAYSWQIAHLGTTRADRAIADRKQVAPGVRRRAA